MSKDTNFISEIGQYFRENDATSAMNKLMDVISTLKLSEKNFLERKADAIASTHSCRFCYCCYCFLVS